MHRAAGRVKAQWEVGIDLEAAVGLDFGFLGHHLALLALKSDKADSRTC